MWRTTEDITNRWDTGGDGNDVRNASSATLGILDNSDLIAVNQDSLGLQGVQVSFDGTRRVLAKRLANGDVAVAMLNQGGTTTTTDAISASVPANGTQPVIWDCHGTDNQRFTHSGNTLQLLGKCLETPTNATAGTRVQLRDCNGGTNQQWTRA
ncbi:ricin-type beta-trefoil lectin domain protein [Saccharothrix sp. HUAS TT1]|uniref:ricin-type beta-trefoil lectin domain protein n=1 Tax=unclassified Saccharothrix TaxID=2593673 RepID=UPI00345C0604